MKEESKNNEKAKAKELSKREIQRITEIAEETNRLIAAAGPVAWSWGISKRVATVFRNRPSLKITVNGFVHKGDVVIALNEGADLYEVHLLDCNGFVRKSFTDVYADMLIGILDREIETGAMSDEEYKKNVEEWLENTEIGK